jgi:DNA-binding transcriptional MerR regulator
VAHLRISEVAERTGLSTTTLRYYESIGLVTAPQRSDGGYRLYDQRTLERIGFITRAKQLGLSLDEVRELVDVWDRDRCTPVQKHLAQAVASKLDAVEARVAELAAFADQLRATLVRLTGPSPTGPCAADCPCAATETAVPDGSPVPAPAARVLPLLAAGTRGGGR